MERFLALVEKSISEFFRKKGFYPKFKNYEETYLIWYLTRDGIHPDWDVTSSSSDFDICVALYYQFQYNEVPDESLIPTIDKYYTSAIKKENHEAVTFYLAWNHEAYAKTKNSFFKEKEISFLWQATVVKHKYLVEVFKKKFLALFRECCNEYGESLTIFKNVFKYDFPLIGHVKNDPITMQILWKHIQSGQHYYIPAYIDLCDPDSFIKLNDVDIAHLNLYKQEINLGVNKFFRQVVDSGLYTSDHGKFEHQRDGIDALREKIRKRKGRDYWRNKNREHNWYDDNTDYDFDDWHDGIYGPDQRSKSPEIIDDYVPTTYKDEKIFRKPREYSNKDIVNFASKWTDQHH